MPEEMNNNTPNTAQNASEPAPATTTAQEPQNSATEPNKAQETQNNQQAAETKPVETNYTIDSYKELDVSDFIKESGLELKDLDSFKKLGVDNKISPEALKAVAKWSLDNIKAQQADFEKMQEGWRQENAKKYGENLKNVKTNVGRVLAEYDKSGSFASLLQHAGAEDNPATLEFLNTIADVLLEKGSINPNATIGEKPFALEDMYKQNQTNQN